MIPYFTLLYFYYITLFVFYSQNLATLLRSRPTSTPIYSLPLTSSRFLTLFHRTHDPKPGWEYIDGSIPA